MDCMVIDVADGKGMDCMVIGLDGGYKWELYAYRCGSYGCRCG